MAIGATRWALLVLLLLAMTFPPQAFAGRQLSAASPETTPQVQVEPDHHASAMRGASRGSQLLGGSMMEAANDAQFQAGTNQLPPKNRQLGKKWKGEHGEEESIFYGHRLLVGSSAPTCQGKCGQCNPCSPIHMAIGSPHGALTQQEYYPEVWRCKCGGIYFMP